MQAGKKCLARQNVWNVKKMGVCAEEQWSQFGRNGYFSFRLMGRWQRCLGIVASFVAVETDRKRRRFRSLSLSFVLPFIPSSLSPLHPCAHTHAWQPTPSRISPPPQWSIFPPPSCLPFFNPHTHSCSARGARRRCAHVLPALGAFFLYNLFSSKILFLFLYIFLFSLSVSLSLFLVAADVLSGHSVAQFLPIIATNIFSTLRGQMIRFKFFFSGRVNLSSLNTFKKCYCPWLEPDSSHREPHEREREGRGTGFL